MSSTTVRVNLDITSTEVLALSDFPGSSNQSDRTLRKSDFNLSTTHSVSTTPAIEKSPVVQQVTIGASATVIDLTAVDVGVGRTEDMTGKKLVDWQFEASSSNSGNVTVEPDATDGYDLFGASGKLVLVPGRNVSSGITGVSSGEAAVSATEKEIKISGTENDVVNLALYFGT